MKFYLPSYKKYDKIVIKYLFEYNVSRNEARCSIRIHLLVKERAGTITTCHCYLHSGTQITAVLLPENRHYYHHYYNINYKQETVKLKA